MFQLQRTIETSELTQVGLSRLGSARQTVSLQAPKDRLLRFRTEQRMGDGRDVVRVDISRILAHAHSSNLVKVGRIDQVFGGMREPRLVRKK